MNLSFLRRPAAAPVPVPSPAPRALPPRNFPPPGRDYTCEPCQVRGHGTHCWCCGTRIGAPT